MKTLLTILINWLKDVFEIKSKPIVVNSVPAPKPIVHSKAWCGGTIEERSAMFKMAQRVCAEEKLSDSMTKDVLATIWGESGFNQWCVNERTKDYGICQFSERYYLKEYKMTPEDTFNNPEKCVRIMARNFKAGRANNWIAYKGGSYKRWLGKVL